MTLSSDTAYNPTVEVTVEGEYFLECNVSKLGCVFNDTLRLKFVDSIYLDLGPDLIVNESFVDLSAYSNADYFQWYNVSINEAEIESPNESTTTISNLITGDYIFSITGSNGICPEKYDEIIIEVDWVFIPNGFSPNGDGINDFFGLDGARDGVSFEIQIVNRWGELVYASSNAFDKWDGTFNGIQIPEDTYFYFIELSSFKYKGAIELRR
jgi:gliding motility-associated-like protein